jgi:hypothetical protein
MDDDKTISRAAMIEKMLVAPIAIGAFAALQAEAQAAASISQATAAYVTHPNGGKQCSGCVQFLPAKTNPTTANGACKLVQGSISPKGYCKFFAAKAK